MSAPAITDQFALDPASLGAVKRQARDDPRAALHVAAQQFEALFLQMVLKAMRDATPQDGMLDGEQTRMYQQMLDQQLAQTLSSKGATGLAAVMERQLARGLPTAPKTADVPAQAEGERFPGLPPLRLNAPAMPTRDGPPLVPAAVAESAAAPQPVDSQNVPVQVREFVNRLWPSAVEASRATGIPAHFMIAHAALETGWGRSEIRGADGRPSFNLFGIKAGRAWSGAVAQASTTEYVNGTAQKSVERFRAYGSYAEAFRDYANLLRSSPRYAAVIGQQDPAAFARGLQQAGYATDPMYADKLTRIIGGAALRQGLMG